MSKCDLSVDFDRKNRQFRSGDVVTGKVTVTVNKDVNCNGIVIGGYWKTHGRGNRDHGLYGQTTVYRGEMAARRSRTYAFRIQVPEAPLTYRGELINVDHYVRVRVDIPWAIDPSLEEEFFVFAGPNAANANAPVHVTATSNPTAVIAVGGVVAAVFFAVGIFMLPMFGLGLIPIGIGLALIFGVLRKPLAERRLGNVAIGLPNTVVSPTGKIPVNLSFTPRKASRINRITATLHGQEIAISGSGTKKKTHRHSLHKETIDLTGPNELMPGKAATYQGVLEVPGMPAHSFATGDNKVHWVVEFHVDIPRWPDWVDSRAIVVVSHSVTSGNRRVGGEVIADTEPREVEIIEAIAIDDDTKLESATLADESTNFAERVNHELESIPAENRPQSAGASDTQQSPLIGIAETLANADRYSNACDQILRKVGDQTFDISITIDRVASTYGHFDDARFSDGRTLSGVITGTDRRVQIVLPQSMNDRVKDLYSGDVWTGTGSISGWDRFYDRIEMKSV